MNIFLIVVICLVLIAIFVYFRLSIKVLKPASVTLVTGGVKTGKSLLSVNMLLHHHFWQVIRWWIYNHTIGIFKGLHDKPLIYSNIPLGVPYVPLTKSHLLREIKIVDYSSVFIDEASLVADSMDWQDKQLNEDLKMFFKLFGHECNGLCVVDTQCVHDVHMSIKRSLNSYFWIQSAIKWIPFVYVAKVREMAFLDDNTLNTFEGDVEDTCKIVLIPKSYFKKYDSRCYSVLTDELPIGDVSLIKTKNLKSREILSFKRGKSIK